MMQSFTKHLLRSGFFVAALLLFTATHLCAQIDWKKRLEQYKIQPVVMLQTWAAYSFDQKLYNPNTLRYEPVENRLNFEMRRVRLGISIKPYENLQLVMVSAMDLVGKDALNATVGTPNNGAMPAFGLWDGFLQWRILDKKETFNFVIGYFRPQFGRESITSGFRVVSMEKSWSQNYYRTHLVGIGSGRSMGINFGGIASFAARTHLRYDAGIFHPPYEAYTGNSAGKANALLFVARLVAMRGDPEAQKYSLAHKTDYFGERQGISIGAQASWQGKTDLFATSKSVGIDFLANRGRWSADGEWIWMHRNSLHDGAVNAQTGHARFAYSLPIANRFVLEPTATVIGFFGEENAEMQNVATNVRMSSGKTVILDTGFNWYFDKDFKLMLHYTYNNGNRGELAEGTTVNSFLTQNSIGAIERGNWIGLGTVLIF